MNDKFIRMKNLLASQGWCQKSLHNMDGKYCIMGAYNMIDHGKVDYLANVVVNKESKKDFNILYDVISYKYPSYRCLHPSAFNKMQSIIDFNNTKGRTKEEIFSVLEEAAKNEPSR